MTDAGTPAFVRAYYASRKAWQRALKLQAAAFDGLWLGALGPERLGRLDEAFYRRTRERHEGDVFGYEDERYPQRGLAEWERLAVERHFPPGGRVLVTGAGSGREVLALLRAGFDAGGLEPNPYLVSTGNRVLEREGHGARLRTMPRSVVAPSERPEWDAAVVGWGSYMLMPGRPTRQAFLRALGTHLRPGAPVLVSTWLRRGDGGYDRSVRGIGNAVRRLRGAEPLELGDALASNFVHRFTLGELEAEIASAGLRPVDSGAEPYGWVVARTADPGP